MKLWCCGCSAEVRPRLTNGREIYPHRRDLAALPFWVCDTCKNFVGCHHKTRNRTHPLGCIPTPKIKEARKHIHRILDPLWKTGSYGRGEVYAELARRLNVPEYHTAEVKSLEEARTVYRHVQDMARMHQ